MRPLLFITVYAVFSFTHPAIAGNKTVILLHGLARTSASMNKMEKALQNNGFTTCNINYPSTTHRIEVLAKEYILPEIKNAMEDLQKNIQAPLHFVTHSMGGIIVRYLTANGFIPHMGRVVMLSPPNKGSELVDKLGKLWFFKFINGPAGQELGTDSSSLPLQLGTVNFELGIITGNRSINLILSSMIEGKDDGKVSIERAKVQGMADFIILPATHPFIMKNRTAIAQTIFFLNHGRFQKE